MSIFSASFNDIGAEELIQKADEYAQHFHKDRLKTTQLRNFYSAILQIRQKFETTETIPNNTTNKFNEVKTDLVLLKPKLAFAAGRFEAVRKNFKPFIEEAIDKTLKAPEDKNQAVQNFITLVESVVAYHKYYE